jgi:hypothetical protein
MRHRWWAAAGLCALWAAAPARAQTAATFGGPNLTQLTYKPVDLSHVIAPVPAQAAQQNRFNLGMIFRKMTGLGSRTLGSSPLPAPASFPSTKYPNFQMVGKPPFQLGQPRSTPVPIPMPYIPSSSTPVGPGSGN